MTKQTRPHPKHIYLSLDDINHILDALNALYQDTEIDHTYNTTGRGQALLEIWSLLDSFFHLCRLASREGVLARTRYYLLPGDLTTTRLRKN